MKRQQILEALKSAEPFDLLVVGGGATGCGIAVDAASRGLKVALVEKNDFSEGTSSRSTKLVHGGVRYLEKAVKSLDREQYSLVKEGLHERGVLLKNAPHLSSALPLVTPLYKWMEIPYIYAGLRFYDFLSGKMGIGHSRLLGRKETLERFPMVKAEGLKGGVLYYDGQFNDARMAVCLTITAEEEGAVVANHVEVTGLTKEGGRISGALAKDSLTGEEFSIRAKGVINATGPFADRLRLMDEPDAAPILKVSSGVHVVLDKRFAPPATGLMIPKTEDGRVLFVLPWQGHALIGTTDDPAEITDHPKVEEEEVEYLLRHAGEYFDLKLTKSDIKATWSGLRPLVFDPEKANTQEIARTHVIKSSGSGLLTITGGKWTSYRRMAEDTIDEALKSFSLKPKRPCQTNTLAVAGGAGYDPAGDRKLESKYGIEPDVALHLNRSYGDRAETIVTATGEGGLARLCQGHPYIEAEVVYSARHEFGVRTIDVLTRRTPLALIDKAAAESAAPRVIELLAAELGWDEARCRAEAELVSLRLNVAL